MNAPARMSPTSDEAQRVRLLIWAAQQKVQRADVAEVCRAFYYLFRKDRQAGVATLDAMLEAIAPKLPDLAPTWGSLRDECERWVAYATPAQAMTMLAECLKEVGHQAPLKYRKRALAALWNTMPADERAAFLKNVERPT